MRTAITFLLLCAPLLASQGYPYEKSYSGGARPGHANDFPAARLATVGWDCRLNGLWRDSKIEGLVANEGFSARGDSKTPNGAGRKRDDVVNPLLGAHVSWPLPVNLDFATPWKRLAAVIQKHPPGRFFSGIAKRPHEGAVLGGVEKRECIYAHIPGNYQVAAKPSILISGSHAVLKSPGFP
jgi:hypothetical protein